jgi:hypothetical protein
MITGKSLKQIYLYIRFTFLSNYIVYKNVNKQFLLTSLIKKLYFIVYYKVFNYSL